MGRLTFDGLFCDIAMCKETPGGTFCEKGSCSQRKVWERLKAYEDTGLEPEEIVGLQKQNALLAQYGAQKFSASMEDFREINSLKLKIQSLETSLGVACDGLNKYTRAEQDGRLVVLPCKVGDQIYAIHQGTTILPMVAKWYETMEGYGDFVLIAHYPPIHKTFRFADFGKTVFLTREEAERALEGGTDNA